MLKGDTNLLSKSTDITLLIEIHNIGDGRKNLYNPIMDLLKKYNFKKEFEILHESRERPLIVLKNNNSHRSYK